MADIETPTWRDKHKIGAIMSRIQRHASGDESVKMTPTQLKAAEIFLRKTLPDLNKTELSGDPDKPIIQRIERTIVDPANSNAASIPPVAAAGSL